jgi:serine protease
VQVAGGGADVLLIDYNAPAPPLGDEAIAVEYYHPAIDHYFVTAYTDEIALLDANAAAWGWQRTGFDFKVWPRGSLTGLPACRFYGRPGVGPNTHFYTIDPVECATVNGIYAWLFEGMAFNAERANGDDCPAGRMQVWRMFNNMKANTPNHRYLTSHSEIARMQGLGWILEGAVYCTPP